MFITDHSRFTAVINNPISVRFVISISVRCSGISRIGKINARNSEIKIYAPVFHTNKVEKH